jgi:hypothetical protein
MLASGLYAEYQKSFQETRSGWVPQSRDTAEPEVNGNTWPGLAHARQVNWKCAKESQKFMANSVSDPKNL